MKETLLTWLLKQLPSFCRLVSWFFGRKPKPVIIHCLIVEDDDNDAHFIQYYITRCGHTWERVDSAEEALNRVADTFFPLVFIDMRLHLMPGATLMSILSKRSRRPKTVVVCGEPGDTEYITPSRLLHIVRKPVSLEAIEDVFNELKL